MTAVAEIAKFNTRKANGDVLNMVNKCLRKWGRKDALAQPIKETKPDRKKPSPVVIFTSELACPKIETPTLQNRTQECEEVVRNYGIIVTATLNGETMTYLPAEGVTLHVYRTRATDLDFTQLEEKKPKSVLPHHKSSLSFPASWVRRSISKVYSNGVMKKAKSGK